MSAVEPENVSDLLQKLVASICGEQKSGKGYKLLLIFEYFFAYIFLIYLKYKFLFMNFN